MSESTKSTRRWPRIELALDVTIRVESLEEAARTLNVSREGLFVQTTTPRPVGTNVKICVALATGERFHADGIVVHVRPDPNEEVPEPGRDLPSGMGIFLTATTLGWRRLCDRLERVKESSPQRGAAPGGSQDPSP